MTKGIQTFTANGAAQVTVNVPDQGTTEYVPLLTIVNPNSGDPFPSWYVNGVSTNNFTVLFPDGGPVGLFEYEIRWLVVF